MQIKFEILLSILIKKYSNSLVAKKVRLQSFSFIFLTSNILLELIKTNNSSIIFITNNVFGVVNKVKAIVFHFQNNKKNFNDL